MPPGGDGASVLPPGLAAMETKEAPLNFVASSVREILFDTYR